MVFGVCENPTWTLLLMRVVSLDLASACPDLAARRTTGAVLTVLPAAVPAAKVLEAAWPLVAARQPKAACLAVRARQSCLLDLKDAGI